MRPRVFPAEDAAASRIHRAMRSSFNEAAGIPRGRPDVVRAANDAWNASMRPRVFPAEDAVPLWTLRQLLRRLQ